MTGSHVVRGVILVAWVFHVVIVVFCGTICEVFLWLYGCLSCHDVQMWSVLVQCVILVLTFLVTLTPCYGQPLTVST